MKYIFLYCFIHCICATSEDQRATVQKNELLFISDIKIEDLKMYIKSNDPNSSCAGAVIKLIKEASDVEENSSDWLSNPKIYTLTFPNEFSGVIIFSTFEYGYSFPIAKYNVEYVDETYNFTLIKEPTVKNTNNGLIPVANFTLYQPELSNQKVLVFSNSLPDKLKIDKCLEYHSFMTLWTEISNLLQSSIKCLSGLKFLTANSEFKRHIGNPLKKFYREVVNSFQDIANIININRILYNSPKYEVSVISKMIFSSEDIKSPEEILLTNMNNLLNNGNKFILRVYLDEIVSSYKKSPYLYNNFDFIFNDCADFLNSIEEKILNFQNFIRNKDTIDVEYYCRRNMYLKDELYNLYINEVQDNKITNIRKLSSELIDFLCLRIEKEIQTSIEELNEDYSTPNFETLCKKVENVTFRNQNSLNAIRNLECMFSYSPLTFYENLLNIEDFKNLKISSIIEELNAIKSLFENIKVVRNLILTKERSQKMKIIVFLCEAYIKKWKKIQEEYKGIDKLVDLVNVSVEDIEIINSSEAERK